MAALSPSSLSFEHKVKWFRARSHALSSRSVIPLKIKRATVFKDSFEKIRLLHPEQLRGKLTIIFDGEEGEDGGGVAREWFQILSKELFNPDYGLFIREGGKSEYNVPNALSGDINPEHLEYFRFVGRLFGKCLLDGNHFDAFFQPFIYATMVGREVSNEELGVRDPILYNNLQSIRDASLEDLMLDLTFTLDVDSFGQTKSIDLIPNGSNVEVNEDNKQAYIDAVCHYKMVESVRPQMTHLLRGLYEVIPKQALHIFSPSELELLLGGCPDVNLIDMQNHTIYIGWRRDEETMGWFWEILNSFSQSDLAKFLQFVTGTSRVPPGGFSKLMGMNGPQKFNIHRVNADGSRLPTAHTCFNQLDLPIYKNCEEMRLKLELAIKEGNEGFGFI